ncbi:hypothetical protein JB92DRAFT_3112392 [Gautieria morchelliformis]|nr:hypothetical protein JB92DRAFT_3112392 [Gautieria morchelliformis]
MSFFATAAANSCSTFSLFVRPQDPREAYENACTLRSLVDPFAPASPASTAYPSAHPNKHSYAGSQPCIHHSEHSRSSGAKNSALFGRFRRIMTGGKSASASAGHRQRDLEVKGRIASIAYHYGFIPMATTADVPAHPLGLARPFHTVYP